MPGTDAETAVQEAARAAAPQAPARVAVVLGIALVVLCCDIVSKALVVAMLPGCVSGRPPIRVVGSVLTLCVSRNAGAAFSIGAQGFTFLFTAIAVTVIVFIVRMSRRIRSVAWAITLGMLLGGATGNLADRLFRGPGPLRGMVVDWIQLPHWPVFNLADSAIVCGGVLAVLLSLRGVRIDGAVGGDGDGTGDGPLSDCGSEPADAAGGDQAGGPGTVVPGGDVT